MTGLLRCRGAAPDPWGPEAGPLRAVLRDPGRGFHQLTLQESVALGEQHAHHDVVLDEAAQRLAVRGHHVLMVSAGDVVALGAAQLVLHHVEVHLIAVKVGVVRVAVGVCRTPQAGRPTSPHSIMARRGPPEWSKGARRTVHPDHALVAQHTRVVRHDAGLV